MDGAILLGIEVLKIVCSYPGFRISVKTPVRRIWIFHQNLSEEFLVEVSKIRPLFFSMVRQNPQGTDGFGAKSKGYLHYPRLRENIDRFTRKHNGDASQE